MTAIEINGVITSYIPLLLFVYGKMTDEGRVAVRRYYSSSCLGRLNLKPLCQSDRLPDRLGLPLRTKDAALEEDDDGPLYGGSEDESLPP